MIVFDLTCADGHRFEGWFGSSADFEDQRARGLLACPACGGADVSKAPMAPAVPAKGNQRRETSPTAESAPMQTAANLPLTPEMARALQAMAKAQAEALKQSTWVGDRFAEKSRAMHYGEEVSAPIHGQASLAEAQALAEEGVPVAPILFPVVPPDQVN